MCSTRSTNTCSPPLEVVDDDNLRPIGRTRLEQAAKCHPRFLRRRRDNRLGRDADRGEHLDQWPVRDALPVREAASAEDVCRVTDAVEEVGDEPRLADPGRAEEREEAARAVGNGVLVVAPEALALAVPSDERGLGVTRERRGIADHLEQPVRLDRRGLALQVERFLGLDADCVANEGVGLCADQDLSRTRRLLEPGGDVHGVTGHEGLALAADDDLARVDPDPCLETVRGDRIAHLRRRAHGAQRIVLVRDRDPEDGHHRVADELLDGSPMSLENRAEILEIPAHTGAQGFRIRRLAERGRPDEVAEEDRDDLALLAHGRSLGANRLQLGELDVRGDRGREGRVEATCAHLAHGRCAGGDGCADGVLGRTLVTDRGEELREEHVARADARHGLDMRRERANPPRLPAEHGEARSSRSRA